MSCQQLIQEDPYIFTDTVSNSTSFMHENNSQTKYVPLNRQTIYNRQFRQHEPKIASTTDLNNSLIKSATYSDHHNNKIVISPTTKTTTKSTAATTLKEKKNSNELNNGKVLNVTRASPNSNLSAARTSPKFFKSHHNVTTSCDVKSNNVKTSNSTTLNHSNASVSKSSKQQQNFNHHESNDELDKCLLDQKNVSDTLENGITGIKKEKEEKEAGMDMGTVKSMIKVEDENSDFKITSMKVIKRENNENYGKLCGSIGDDRSSNSSSNKKKSNVSNQNVIVEPILSELNAPLVQLKLNVIDKRLLQQNYGYCGSNISEECSNRDERLSMRKMHLRHVLSQYKGINRLRDTERYKMQISKSFKYCKIMEREKQRIFKKSIRTCSMKDCSDEALLLSDYCPKHILLTSDKEQFLIRQCCFRQLDGQQCRVPVSNILATIAVCNDHMNAPAHQLICSDSTEPKKNPVQRKRAKTSPLIRPVKKNVKCGRKKKMMSTIAQSTTNGNIVMPAHRPTMIIHPNDVHHKQHQVMKINNGNSPSTTLLKQENLHHHQNDSNQFIHFNSGNLLASSQSSYGSMSSGNEDLYIKQDLMPGVCGENSDLSEDTGVGGLSENELISHDVIGHFDIESCAELSKVLSSLPSNTLDDLLTEPLHTSRDDEEYLDRAIEEVSASGMDQIAITAFEHLEGLDMLELDDDEQRQMISAATNLISMSGYLSHDQDNNYSAMPSPMMS